MYGANGSFMKLRLLLFRRVFLLHIKIPTHPRAFSARLLDRISHVCFDSTRIKSIGKDVEKECKKENRKYVESLSSEPQPFDTAVTYNY